MEDPRSVVISETIKAFDSDKKFGKGVLLTLAQDGLLCNVNEWASTGSLLLDYSIGFNEKGAGIPVGRLTEIHGETGEGKSTLCSHIAAGIQAIGGIVLYIDTENAMNPAHAAKLCLKKELLIYSQPECIEDAFTEIESFLSLIKANPKLQQIPIGILLDSIAALPPKAELEGDYGQYHVGLAARLIAQAMRKIMSQVAQHRVFFVITNQIKYGIGGWGDNETTPGGRAIPYHASVRMKIRRTAWLKRADNSKYGQDVSITIVKNKISNPWKTVTLPMYFDGGIQDKISWFGQLQAAGKLKSAGGWWKMVPPQGGDVISFRAEQFYNEYLNDPVWVPYLRRLVLESFGDVPMPTVAEPMDGAPTANPPGAEPENLVANAFGVESTMGTAPASPVRGVVLPPGVTG